MSPQSRTRGVRADAQDRSTKRPTKRLTDSESAGSVMNGAAKGASKHAADCTCTRCVGFEPGHEISMKHGSYAVVQLAPRAAEIADAIRERKGDAWSDEYAPAAETAALALARVERALGFLLELDEETIEAQFSRLDDRAKGWVRLALQNLEALGMTPKVSAGEPSGPVTIVVGTAFPNVTPAADLTLEPADVLELPEETS